MMIASLASVIQLSLTYPHVFDEAQVNNHQASYLVSIRLIFVIVCKKIMMNKCIDILANFLTNWVIPKLGTSPL